MTSLTLTKTESYPNLSHPSRERCKQCGQRLPLPGVVLTSQQRKFWNLFWRGYITNRVGFSVYELRKAIYGTQLRSPNTVSSNLTHFRKRLKNTEWRIVNIGTIYHKPIYRLERLVGGTWVAGRVK